MHLHKGHTEQEAGQHAGPPIVPSIFSQALRPTAPGRAAQGIKQHIVQVPLALSECGQAPPSTAHPKATQGRK